MLQEKNIAITTENVKAGDYTAYLAKPSVGDNLPGVLVFHEIYGLNDNIRDITRRFAQEGYIALAVDMYSVGSNRALCVFQTFRHIAINARKSSHIGKLDVATKFLQLQPQVNPEKIGIIGFCMGGGYALAYALHNPDIKVLSVFYGTNPKPLEDVAQICPVVGSYAEKDPFLPTRTHPNAARQLEAALTRYERPHDIKIYPNTKHSFFDDTSPSHNPEASADAWKRTLTFFQETLNGKDTEN